MAVIKKTLFAENLDKYNTFVVDTAPNSTYFNVTEIPDAFTGGKNAFLIAGSKELVADTLVKIEIKDAAGNTIYHEPGEGIVSSSIDGETFVTEYYEGVSKVVALYVYPDTTAYGPCTITILGELSSYYDGNGLLTPIPIDWQGTYNVKWQRTVNVNPTLANTTKIRFYKRPTATIREILSPIYRIESGSKVDSGVNQSFAEIKLSQLETFAGDVKRVKVFRTSEGDISDFNLIQDILVESKELLTTTQLSGSVIGNTGTFTSEVLPLFWNTGSLTTELTSSRVESGLKLNGSGLLTYSQSLNIKASNTYELNLDAFYSSSTASNLGIYISGSDGGDVLISTLNGITPTKNLLDTVVPFKLDSDFESGSLYFSQSQGEWHLGNISLRLSEDTAFSPDEISFITTMPTVIGNETYNFKFEFYDVNNNFVPVAVTQSANFTGGTTGVTTKLLTFDSDRTAFRFSSGSFGNPAFQQLGFKVSKSNLTGSVTYGRSVFDTSGNYIVPASYAGTYPGTLTNVSDAGATLTIANFSGSVTSVLVGSIVYTASCEGLEQFETVYRFEDGENAPGLFVTSNTNQFIYKATDLSLNPVGQTITIEAKRKNLASATTPLTVNSGSGKPPLTFVDTNATNGVDTYTLSGTSYPFLSGSTTYFISGSDQFGNQFSDAVTITPIKILDGLSVNLTNENASLPALSTGFVTSASFAATSGSVSVKVGGEDIVRQEGLTLNNRFDVISATGTNCTPNDTTPDDATYGITTLTADSGSLTLLVRYKDGAGDTTDVTKVVTYSKSKRGVPNVEVAVTPTAQSIQSNSRGSGSATPQILTVTALEGGTTRFTSLGTPTYTNGLAGSVSTNTIVFSSNASSMTSDSATVTIPVNFTDSEGVSGTKNVTATISRVRSSAPVVNISANPQSQTVTSGSLVGIGIPSNVTVVVNEGGSNYTYNTSGANTFNITGVTNATNNGNGTITPNTPTSISGTSGVITISYRNSEGTSFTGRTIDFEVGVSGIGNTGATGATGATGPAGANGANGTNGLRTAAGMVHYQLTTTSAPSGPSATSYTFSNGTFSGLTANWGTGAPTYASGNTNKYWYATYTAVETTPGGGTGTVSFGSPTQAIGFSGLVSFTSANAVDNGLGNSLSFGVTGATLINGSNISTGKIISTNYSAGSPYTTAGSIIDLDNGRIATKTFYVDSNGDAVFKGTLSAAAGTFAGTLSAAAGTFTGALSGGTISIGSGNSIFKADSNGIYLGNATFASAPFRVNPDGVLTATSATITGTVTATAGAIGGWDVDSTKISKTSTGTIEINSSDLGFFIKDGSRNAVIMTDDTSFRIASSTSALSDFSGTDSTIRNGAVFGQNLQSEASTIFYSNNVSTTVAAGTEVSMTDAEISAMIANSLSTSYLMQISTATYVQTYHWISLEVVGVGEALIASGYVFYNGASYERGITSTGGASIVIPSGGTYNVRIKHQIGVNYLIGGESITLKTPNFTGVNAVVGSAPRSVEICQAGLQSLYGSNQFKVDTSLSATNFLTVKGSSNFSGLSTFSTLNATVGAITNLSVGEISLSSGTLTINGDIRATGDIYALASSDKRLKENIIPISNPMDKIKKIGGYTFNWNGVSNKPKHIQEVGVLAQEIQEVLPEVVKEKGDGYLGVDYEKIIALLIEGIKEQNGEIAELKNEITSIKKLLNK
jgi:hypothetical protein